MSCFCGRLQDDKFITICRSEKEYDRCNGDNLFTDLQRWKSLVDRELTCNENAVTLKIIWSVWAEDRGSLMITILFLQKGIATFVIVCTLDGSPDRLIKFAQINILHRWLVNNHILVQLCWSCLMSDLWSEGLCHLWDRHKNKSRITFLDISRYACT